jgi:hypothetical protein
MPDVVPEPLIIPSRANGTNLLPVSARAPLDRANAKTTTAVFMGHAQAVLNRA